MFVAGDPDLAAGVLAEQHAVALPHVERVQLAIVVDASLADREHLALHRLLLGGVGDDEPALGLRFLVDAFHEDPVVQRSYVRHASMLLIGPAHAGQTGLKSNGRAPEWSRLHRMQLTSSDASGAKCGGRLVKSNAVRVEITGSSGPIGRMRPSVLVAKYTSLAKFIKHHEEPREHRPPDPGAAT